MSQFAPSQNEKQYQGLGITCKTAAVYSAGSAALFQLQFSGCTDEHKKIKVRAIGRLHAEKRWIKSSFGDVPITETFSGMDAQTNECVIFKTEYVTPLEKDETLQTEENFFVQFDLPVDVLPTYKGLSVIMHYNLEIVIAADSGSSSSSGKRKKGLPVDAVRFPFSVEGEGSGGAKAYSCRGGAISYFSVANLNEEAQFSRPYQADPSLLFSLVKKTRSVYATAASASSQDQLLQQQQQQEDNDEGIEEGGRGGQQQQQQQETVVNKGLSSHSYNINDDGGLICTLHILRAGFGNFLLPGDDINVRTDFLHTASPCDGIRAKIVQKELRNTDNSRISERVVSMMAKGTEHAAVLNITLPIPVDTTPTFDCPVTKLRYYLEFSFFRESAAGDDDSSKREPFSWSIPLTIAPRSSISILGEHERYTSPLELTHYWPKSEDALA